MVQEKLMVDVDVASLLIIPVEAKKTLLEKHACQMSDCISKISLHESLKANSVIGVLMDPNKFKLAFSVFADDTSLPLPVVLVSPSVTRMDKAILPEAIGALALSMVCS